jgi:hypothetical protein
MKFDIGNITNVKEFQIWFKWDKNTGQFIWRPKYIGLFIVDSSTKYFVTAQRKGDHCCLSMTTLKEFYIADRGMWIHNTKG